MAVAWGARLTDGSLSWGARTASASEGVINGNAEVSAFVERDLVLSWQLNGGVESDLSLLWQLDASPITAVESDLQLTWNVITAAGTYVEADLSLLWQRGGSVYANLDLVWQIPTIVPYVVPMSESSARFLIQQAGFIVETTNDSSQYIAFGDVISTYPAGGTAAAYGSTVLMYVSIGTQRPGEHGAGYPVNWQGKRKKLKLVQQPNKHLKKLLDDEGKKVLARRAKKKPSKVQPIKLWP